MKRFTFTVASAALVLGSIGCAAAAANDHAPGASGAAPGHEMQEYGDKVGPGASPYAPGRDPDERMSRDREHLAAGDRDGDDIRDDMRMDRDLDRLHDRDRDELRMKDDRDDRGFGHDTDEGGRDREFR